LKNGNNVKTITQHRVLTYLLQNRIISSYGKMMKKEYRNEDLITGQTGWCDFSSTDEWGEIVLVYQENLPVQWLREHLFSINIKEVEEQYKIKVDPDSIPPLLQDSCVSPTILLDTQSAIRIQLEKKLNKTYPYQQKNYSRQGALILAIFDPTFGGFSENLEIRCNTLDLGVLEKVARNLAPTSSFSRILIVDGLAPFEENIKNCTYELLPA
jgi:hypothetical protein